MSDINNPEFSIGEVTSLKLGVYPPGKIYLFIHGCGFLGGFVEPIVCIRANPSSFNRFETLSKNFL